MSDTARWLIVIVVLMVIIGLVAFARGGEHRRGDDIGAFDSIPITITFPLHHV